jgi:hypothetical protein
MHGDDAVEVVAMLQVAEEFRNAEAIDAINNVEINDHNTDYDNGTHINGMLSNDPQDSDEDVIVEEDEVVLEEGNIADNAVEVRQQVPHRAQVQATSPTNSCDVDVDSSISSFDSNIVSAESVVLVDLSAMFPPVTRDRVGNEDLRQDNDEDIVTSSDVHIIAPADDEINGDNINDNRNE